MVIILVLVKGVWADGAGNVVCIIGSERGLGNNFVADFADSQSASASYVVHNGMDD